MLLEAALMVLVAAGGFFFLTSHWQPETKALPDMLTPSPNLPQQQVMITHGGLYSLHKAGSKPSWVALHDLELHAYGLSWLEGRQHQRQRADFAWMVWLSDITHDETGLAEIHIHLEVEGRYRILQLRITEAAMSQLIRWLNNVIPAARSNIGRAPTQPIGPVSVRMVHETLQGDIQLGAEVSVFVLPHLVVLLSDDMIQAKLDISSIRRVLAVERVQTGIDQILSSNQPMGILRLYSLYETAAFALPQYRELAQEIAYLARCPLDFVTRNEKVEKR